MTAEEHKQAIKELTLIPGVGRDIADDLIEMGITRVGQLKNKDPEKLYSKSNREKGVVRKKDLRRGILLRWLLYQTHQLCF